MTVEVAGAGSAPESRQRLIKIRHPSVTAAASRALSEAEGVVEGPLIISLPSFALNLRATVQSISTLTNRAGYRVARTTCYRTRAQRTRSENHQGVVADPPFTTGFGAGAASSSSSDDFLVDATAVPAEAAASPFDA